jgi:integrase/recombinase XerD
MAMQLWVEFFQDLEHVRGRSRNTILAYRHDIEIYEKYRELSNDMQGFYQYMKKIGLSPRSQARVISSVRTYYRFLESRDIKAPELRDLKAPKVKVGLPRVLTPGEFQILFKSVDAATPENTARNRLTLLLLYGLGCRVSELVDLNLADYHENESWLAVMGKGGKQRAVPLTEGLNQELKAYLKLARPKLTDENLSAPVTSVLINDRGKRPSRVDIWRWLAAWSERAGFPEPVSPHRFRHGCATALLEAGADLRSIQMLLGHASIQTTQIYTSVSTQHIKATIDEHHPLSGLDREL